VGDVFVLKNALEELKLLNESQKQEIEELRRSASEEKVLREMEETVLILKQYEER
jgi:hypothetical protein